VRPLRNKNLRKTFKLPDIKTLLFAFGGNADNPYLLHNHQTHSVAYTRTHDNDTSLSWYENLSLGERQRLRDYLDFNVEANMPWPLIRCAILMCCMIDVGMRNEASINAFCLFRFEHDTKRDFKNVILLQNKYMLCFCNKIGHRILQP